MRVVALGTGGMGRYAARAAASFGFVSRIANVMRSGLRAAEADTGVELRPGVLAGEVLADRSRLPPLPECWDAWRQSH